MDKGQKITHVDSVEIMYQLWFLVQFWGVSADFVKKKKSNFLKKLVGFLGEGVLFITGAPIRFPILIRK